MNLHVFNDPEKSTAAIEQISDAVYREMVKGWRADWERQHAK